MKRMTWALILAILVFLLVPTGAAAQVQDPSTPFDLDAQLDALGKDELMDQVPQEARELMEETGLYDLSVENLLQLTPREFFPALWRMLVRQLKAPARTMAGILGILVLCSLLGGMKSASWENSLSPVFSTVSVLCILASVAAPILDCILEVSEAIRSVSVFMLSFIPMFSAAMVASGQTVTGATYNMFLFGTCQVVSQVVSQTLLPLMGIYLALCITGSLVPDINITSATATIKSIISWALGFVVTIFVGLLSVQTLVSQGADSVTTKAAKFMLGSFVPVVGSALSEAFLAAQGCLRLIKTTVGAYGLLVALFTFLPVLLQTFVWYMVTNLAATAGELLGVPRVPGILKACASMLGIMLSIILCYALLIIVSTAVVMATGAGTA